jgi:hypothetical protein
MRDQPEALAGKRVRQAAGTQNNGEVKKEGDKQCSTK